MNEREAQIQGFVTQTLGAASYHPLQGDASFRRYIRLGHAGRSYMLMDAPPQREDVRPFVSVCRGLCEAGFSAPHVLAQDVGQGLLLLEDLGDDTFARLLRETSSAEQEYYEAAIAVLAAWHRGAVSSSALGLAPYDASVLLREVTLFAHWFLPQILDGALLQEAQASYLEWWEQQLASAPLLQEQFVHRDYHADNLMWLPSRAGFKRVGLLDFQDALAGDPAYDLVSLLEDARRDVSADLAEHLYGYYLRASGADPIRFGAAYALLAAQRNSKIVGIFTRLAARDGKLHYLEYLPRVWHYLMRDVAHPTLAGLQVWYDRYVPEPARGVIAIRKNAEALGLAA